MKSRLRRIGNTSPEPEDRIRKLYRLRRIGDIRSEPEDRTRKLHHLRSIGDVKDRIVQRQLQI